MTVKLSISVPDDVAAYLQGQDNVSAVVTEAIRRLLPEARRTRQREAAQAYGAYVRGWNDEQRAYDRTLIETSNDIALHGSEW